jgi:chromosome segregation protein
MIDKKILQSPAERKDFFDEASGIKEFQIKRHQADLKLNRTEEHMREASMLLKEIAPRLASLEKQVKKLEQRAELEIQLRELQEQYYGTLAMKYKTSAALLTEDMADLSEDADTQQQALTKIQEELALLAQGNTRQDTFLQLQETHDAIVREQHAKERDLAVLQGKMQTEYAQAGKQNLGWLEGKIVELSEKCTGLEEQIAQAQAQQTQIEQTIRTLTEEKETLALERTTARATIGRLEAQLLDARSAQHVRQATGLTAVEAILDNTYQFPGVRGIVAELGRTEPSYQLALDIAAGAHLSSIVVDRDRTAEECIAFLRNHRLGYATFLPQQNISPRDIPHYIDSLLGIHGVHGLAVDLIEYDEQYDDIFLYIFGSTLIVEDIETARRVGIGRARMVTLEGDIMERGGSMKGGYRKRGGMHRLSFSTAVRGGGERQADAIAEEIETLRAEYEKLELRIATVDASLRDAEGQKSMLDSRTTLLHESLAQAKQEHARLEQERAQSSMSKEEYSASLQAVATQKDQVEVEISQLKEKRAEAAKAIETYNQREEEKKQRVFALQDQMQELQTACSSIQQVLGEKRVALAKIETKQEDLIAEVYQELRIGVEQILERNQDLVPLDQLDHIQATIQKVKYKLHLIGGIDEAVVEEYEETKARHDGLAEQLDDLHAAAKDLRKLIDELDTMMRTRRKKAFTAIKKEFARYFSLLFEGGKADLVEQYGPAVQEQSSDHQAISSASRGKKILTGIDVVACPPGKKIEHLQSLSGGERTMTAIALICAILHTNPSPFVVLDEVEAALDEANSLRLSNILTELSSQSQFILITHNRVTMHASDALYGVTMGNDGMSRLLSVSLAEAKRSVE